jgi:hypothetical protein
MHRSLATTADSPLWRAPTCHRIQVQGGTTAQLLRERGYLHSSTSQIDDVIGQAQAVRML